MSTVIRVDELERTYGEGAATTPALRGLSLEVEDASFTAIVGPSGCGKSTLLAILAGLDSPCRGQATSCGLDLVSASRRDLVEYRRRHVAMVFQAYNLVPSLTALENVEVGLELIGLPQATRRRRALDALAQLELAHLCTRYPAQLSGGEQQRVAIARALARSPRLLLADEPTGNLDREAGARVCAALVALVETTGATCLLVTHDEALARSADRIVHLRDGVVVSAVPTAGSRVRGRPSPPPDTPSRVDIPSGVRLQEQAAERGAARAAGR